jgi:hypothetical protein
LRLPYSTGISAPFSALPEYLGRIIENLEGGTKRVAAVCTDSAANMRKMRRLLTADKKFHHILDLPCTMHQFSLLMGSILAFKAFSNLIRRVTVVVQFFRASHRPGAYLKVCLMSCTHLRPQEVLGPLCNRYRPISLPLNQDKARESRRSGTLETPNKTRFTSVYNCLASAYKHQDDIKAVVEAHQNLIKQGEKKN